MDLLDSMKVYVCTVEKGNLSTAALQGLGIVPQPTILLERFGELATA